jgi:hypothetical protein
MVVRVRAATVNRARRDDVRVHRVRVNLVTTTIQEVNLAVQVVQVALAVLDRQETLGRLAAPEVRVPLAVPARQANRVGAMTASELL